MTNAQSLLFVFGLGYSAAQLTARLRPQGWQIGGTVRTEEKAARLRAEGIEAVAWTGQGPVTPPPGAHWLITLPPGAEGCPAALVAGATARTAASVTYLSTTGVYGDRRGGWVHEESALIPAGPRGRARVAAEAAWLAAGLPAVEVFRLAGIYGPGRSALDRLREGRAQRVVKPGQIFSRIHVDDIAGALAAGIAGPEAGAIWNVADDEPAPPQDVIAFAADLLGMPPPAEVAFADAALSPMAQSFYGECKRVANARLRARPGFVLVHPDYRAGLRAILAAGG